MNKPLSALLATLLLFVVGVPLWAADDASDEDDDNPVDIPDYVEYVEVKDSSLPQTNTIATKLPLSLQLTPANVGTVGGPLIYEQNASVLGEVLENVSGLNVQNGSGVHDYFVIRGFDSVSSSLLLIDGASEPEVSFYNTYNVKGVEVFKGPAGFLYGGNPLGGAVNIVREQPLEGDFAAFQGSFGSFGTTEGTLDWNQSGENVSFRLNGLWQESDHYRDDMDSEHVAVNPSLTWRIGENSSLNFNFEHVDADYSPDSGLPLVGNAIPNVSRKRSYQSAGDFSEQTLDRFQVDFETRLNDTVTLRNKTYYRDLDWRTDGTLLRGTLEADAMTPWLMPGDVQVIRDLAVLDDRQEFIGNQFEAVFSLTSGSVEHHLLAGLEVMRQKDKYDFEIQALPDVELSTLQETFVDIGTPATLESPGDVENEVIAPYVMDQITFSPEFQLLLGARYDDISVDGSVKSLLSPVATTFSRDDSEVSPFGGFVWAPSQQLSLYANAGQSYAPPSTRLVDELQPENREPEKGTQYEIGVKQSLAGDRVRTTFALYQVERENIAIPDLNFFTAQSGDQRSRGAEIEVAAELRPGLKAFFSYAYNDAELTDFTPCVPNQVGGCDIVSYTDNTPIMAPENVANLWISKRFANGFGVAGGARFVDEQFISEDNLFKIDSSVVLDGSLFYDMKAWRFKLNLQNLTDEEYENRGIAGATSIIPADPFAVYGSIEFRM